MTVEDGRAIVAVVGIGMRRTPGLAARVFKALGPTNVEVISQGASGHQHDLRGAARKTGPTRPGGCTGSSLGNEGMGEWRNGGMKE